MGIQPVIYTLEHAISILYGKDTDAYYSNRYCYRRTLNVYGSEDSFHELATAAPTQMKRLDDRKSFFAFQIFTHLKNGESGKVLEMIGEIDQKTAETVDDLLQCNEPVRWTIYHFIRGADPARFSHYPPLEISLPVRAIWPVQAYNEALHQTVADNLGLDMPDMGYKMPTRKGFIFLPDKKPIESTANIQYGLGGDCIHLMHVKPRKERTVPAAAVFGTRYPAMNEITVEEPDVFIINGRNMNWKPDRASGIMLTASADGPAPYDQVKYISGRTLVLWAKGANLYSHWMFDLYPKIHLMREQGNIDLKYFDQVVGNKGPVPVSQLLLNDHSLTDKYIPVSPPTRYFFEEATYITPVRRDSWTPQWIIDLWRSKALKKTDKTDYPRRIHISRARARRRKLINEEEVQPLLDQAGFETVFCEDLNLYEVANMFNQAEAVIGLHGAGLANTVFCRPTTPVIELVGWHYMNEYRFMAEACGLNYTAVLCFGPDRKRTDRSVREKYNKIERNHADVYIPHDLLKQTLRSLNLL